MPAPWGSRLLSAVEGASVFRGSALQAWVLRRASGGSALVGFLRKGGSDRLAVTGLLGLRGAVPGAGSCLAWGAVRPGGEHRPPGLPSVACAVGHGGALGTSEAQNCAPQRLTLGFAGLAGGFSRPSCSESTGPVTAGWEGKVARSLGRPGPAPASVCEQGWRFVWPCGLCSVAFRLVVVA